MSLRNAFASFGAAMLAGAGLTLSGAAPALGQGDDLPAATFTSAQADRGRDQYRRYCIDCHGENLDDGEFGGAPLRGTSFRDKWFGGSADSLFEFMRAAMPPDRPGALSVGTYADIMAYILSRNGVQTGPAELPPDPEVLSNFMLR